MREWGASAGGCTYVFRATFVPWLALAGAVALFALVGLRIAFVRWRRRDGTTGGPTPPGAFAGAGLAALSVVAALASTACQTVKLDESFRADVLFQPLVLTCELAFAAGLALLVVAIVQLVFCWRMPWTRLLPWGIGALLASLACFPLALLQVAELGRSYLPVIDLPAPVGFHVGMTRHARPQLSLETERGGRIPLDGGGWKVDDVVFEASAPGVVERTATARQGLFAVSAKVQAKAHGDAGSPWLPLRVGNEWHYTLTTTSRMDGTRYLLVFSGSTSTDVKTAEVIVAIEAAPARDGWREYTLVVKGASGDALGQHVLRPMDDETYYYDPSSRSGVDPPDEPKPFDPKCALQVLLDVDPGSTPERGCRMANMGAGLCQMGGASDDVLPPPIVSSGAPKKPAGRPSSKAAPPLVLARVPTQYALAGPSHLSTHWESHGGAASWIVGVLTVGIVIPVGMSGGEEYVLTRTVRGPGS